MSAVARGFRNPFRNRVRTGVVLLLLAVIIGLFAVPAQGTLATRQQLESLQANVRTVVELREAGAFGTGGFGADRPVGAEDFSVATLEQIRRIPHARHITKIEEYIHTPQIDPSVPNAYAMVIEALAGADLEIEGRGMDMPTEGEVLVAGQAVNRLSAGELTRFRRQTVGFVFQAFNLIPNLTALENVALPMEFNGMPKAARAARAKALLERFQLGHRLKHHPRELSGGEMPRVAIARAVANEPRLVLADEPTGNLDSRSGQLIYELLQELSRERTVLVVTHAQDLARLAGRVIHIRDGRLADATPGSAAPLTRQEPVSRSPSL